MSVNPIPKGYHTITPYFSVRDAHGLVDFLKRAFDAVAEIHTMPDGSIMNAQVQVGTSMVLIGQASKDQPADKLMPAMLYMYVEDVDAVYGKAIAAGGESIVEPRDQFYGDRVGAVRDLSGNQWWIASHKEEMTSEEMTRRAAERNRP
jgi:PhnB protein